MFHGTGQIDYFVVVVITLRAALRNEEDIALIGNVFVSHEGTMMLKLLSSKCKVRNGLDILDQYVVCACLDNIEACPKKRNICEFNWECLSE